MIRRGVVFAVGLMPLAAAAAGEARPVACDPRLALEPGEIAVQLGGADRPAATSGTVHPKAVVAVLEAGDRKLAVAIDARKGDAETHDVVRLDFTGEGRFAGAPAVTLTVRRKMQGYLDADFGPAVVQAPSGGRSIPVRVEGRCYGWESGRRLTLKLGAALEARCRFGAREATVRIVDGDHNLAFGDKARLEIDGGSVNGLNRHDTVLIDLGDGSFSGDVVKAYYGHPAFVDGAWYDVALSPDGKRITAGPSSADLAMLEVAHKDWAAKLAGRRHVLNLRGSAEPVAIPADRYVVLEYRERAQVAGKTERAWFLSTWGEPRAADAVGWLDAAAGKTIRAVLGSPLTAGAAAEVDGRLVKMRFLLQDAAGMEVDGVSLPGASRPPVQLEIRDAAGTPVHSGQFAYG